MKNEKLIEIANSMKEFFNCFVMAKTLTEWEEGFISIHFASNADAEAAAEILENWGFRAEDGYFGITSTPSVKLYK